MNAHEIKRRLSTIYKETRAVEIEVNRGKMTNTDAIQETLMFQSRLVEILNEIVEGVIMNEQSDENDNL